MQMLPSAYTTILGLKAEQAEVGAAAGYIEIYSVAQRTWDKKVITFWGHDFLKRRIRMTPQASDIPSEGLEPDTTDECTP